MSDTPETDDNIRYYLAPQMREEHAIVLADFSRKIERERDQWRECAENLAQGLRVFVDRRRWRDEALAKFDNLKKSI